MGRLRNRSRRDRWDRWDRAEKIKLPEYARGDKAKILVCWNEYWTAGAMWKRTDGVWVCVSAEPRIEWMRKCCPEEAKLELARLGCQWQWRD